MALILASASPRRKELLEQVGCDFTIMPSAAIEDNAAALSPRDLAIANATAKARDVAERVGEDDVIIGADTLVFLADKVFGKPRDRADARQMLTALAGCEHSVVTGVAVIRGRRTYRAAAETIVRMRPLSENEIESYLACGEYVDKAGAYAIQGRGALLAEGIVGCYSNVVGLPLAVLSRLLAQAEVHLL